MSCVTSTRDESAFPPRWRRTWPSTWATSCSPSASSDVLQHVASGNRNRDIGERLFISEETVKVHIKHIMEKLGASDRTEAVTIAVRRGIIRL